MTAKKFVISLPMADARKSSKAFTTVAKFPGVKKAEVQNGKVIVVGERIDSHALICSLRKVCSRAEIVTVAQDSCVIM